MWVCKSAFCHWFAFSIVISLSVLFSRTMCSPFNAVCLCTFSIYCHLSLCFVININFGAFHFQPLFRLRSTAKHAEQYLWWCDRRWRVNNAFDRLKSLCADPEKKVDWKFSEIKTPFTFMKRLVISICGWPLPLHTHSNLNIWTRITLLLAAKKLTTLVVSSLCAKLQTTICAHIHSCAHTLTVWSIFKETLAFGIQFTHTNKMTMGHCLRLPLLLSGVLCGLCCVHTSLPQSSASARRKTYVSTKRKRTDREKTQRCYRYKSQIHKI